MGSYNVYCSISNLSISVRQKCLILLLRKNEKHNPYVGYLPVTLPIYGEYDDYGGLDNVEITDNISLLENYFNCDIYDLLSYVIHKEELIFDHVDELNKYEYCFIDRQVYDYLGNSFKSDLGNYRDQGNKYLLEYLGFTFVGKDLSKERYNLKYQIDDIIVYSDGTYIDSGSYYLKSFKELNKFVNNSIDVNKINTLFSLNSYEIDKLIKYDIEELLEHFWLFGVDRFYTHVIKFSNYEYRQNFMRELKNYYGISLQYLNNYLLFYDEVVKLLLCIDHLSYLNKVFMPNIPYISGQDTKYREYIKINKKFNQIAQSYI